MDDSHPSGPITEVTFAFKVMSKTCEVSLCSSKCVKVMCTEGKKGPNLLRLTEDVSAEADETVSARTMVSLHTE